MPPETTRKFVDLFGDFKLARKTVFLEKADTSDEDDLPSRPTIEERDAFLAAAAEEVRAFPEFREMDLEEVRAFPEFREIGRRPSFLQYYRRSRCFRRAEQEVREFPEFAEVAPARPRERP